MLPKPNVCIVDFFFRAGLKQEDEKSNTIHSMYVIQLWLLLYKYKHFTVNFPIVGLMEYLILSLLQSVQKKTKSKPNRDYLNARQGLKESMTRPDCDINKSFSQIEN